MTGTYDLFLVGLSAIIAIVASYAALGLAGLVTVTRGTERNVWLTLGAISMGMGIWSMHFIAMLAYSLPITVNYNFAIVLVSLVAAILASGQALFIVSRPTMSTPTLLAGSASMGIAIAAMHYIGMAALQMPADVHYDPIIFTLSVVIAIVVSLVALLLAFKFRTETGSVANKLKIISAVVMGVAVLTMHYTGMAAARITANDNKFSELIGNNKLSTAAMVGLITFVVLGLALFFVYFDSDSRSTQQ